MNQIRSWRFAIYALLVACGMAVSTHPVSAQNGSAARPAGTIDNQTIVALINAKASTPLIVAAINGAKISKLDVSADALTALKRDKADDDVIRAAYQRGSKNALTAVE